LFDRPKPTVGCSANGRAIYQIEASPLQTLDTITNIKTIFPINGIINKTKIKNWLKSK